jgi:hypothetical protein
MLKPEICCIELYSEMGFWMSGVRTVMIRDFSIDISHQNNKSPESYFGTILFGQYFEPASERTFCKLKFFPWQEADINEVFTHQKFVILTNSFIWICMQSWIYQCWGSWEKTGLSTTHLIWKTCSSDAWSRILMGVNSYKNSQMHEMPIIVAALSMLYIFYLWEIPAY